MKVPASRNQIASRRSFPRARIQAASLARVPRSSRITVDEQGLAGEEELPARLRSGDRGGRHELCNLADGVGAEVVVVEVLAHR